eukprot:12921095-Prorocentrum_lima.AAC.1
MQDADQKAPYQRKLVMESPTGQSEANAAQNTAGNPTGKRESRPCWPCQGTQRRLTWQEQAGAGPGRKAQHNQRVGR